MTKVFSKELLDRCKIYKEGWDKLLHDLDKNHEYLVGSFRTEEKRVMVSYRDGVFYFRGHIVTISEKGIFNEDSSKRWTESVNSYADYYNFKSLSRAYEYFEQMFYGQGGM